MRRSNSINLRLPSMRERRFVPTEQTRKIHQLTLAAISDGGLVAWTGREGVGKTASARDLIDKVNARFTDSKGRDGFRAHYFQTGRIRGSHVDDRRALRSLYGQIIGFPMSDYQYRSLPPEAVATQIVLTLQRKQMRLVAVDEAGMLSLGAMQALVLVRDIAEASNWRMTFLLIGMEDLVLTLNEPKIKRRIHRWCPFEEYDLAEVKGILVGIHPHFAQAWTTTMEEEAAYLHKVCGGFPGSIIFFLGRVDELVADFGATFDLRAMKAAHEYAVGDEKKAQEIMRLFNSAAARSQRPQDGRAVKAG